MASKKASASEAPASDLLGAGSALLTEEMAVFGGSAAAVGAIPLYVFLAIKGLTFEGNAIIFAVITSFTGVALYFSYLNASTQKKAVLEQARRAQKSNFSGSSALSKQERKALLQAHEDRERANIAIEAAAYVVGTNNLIFLAVFVVLATLLPVPALYNYILSVGAAAGSVVLLTNRKK